MVAPNRHRWVCCDRARAQSFGNGLRAAVATFQGGRQYELVMKVERPLTFDEAALALDRLQGLVVGSLETMAEGRYKYLATMRGVPVEHAPRELRDAAERPVVRWWSHLAGKWCYARSAREISAEERALRTPEEIQWIKTVLDEQ